jgi:hypothetical protein
MTGRTLDTHRSNLAQVIKDSSSRLSCSSSWSSPRLARSGDDAGVASRCMTSRPAPSSHLRRPGRWRVHGAARVRKGRLKNDAKTDRAILCALTGVSDPSGEDGDMVLSAFSMHDDEAVRSLKPETVLRELPDMRPAAPRPHPGSLEKRCPYRSNVSVMDAWPISSCKTARS